MTLNNPVFEESCMFNIGDLQYAAYPREGNYVSDICTGKCLITVIPIPVELASFQEYVLSYVDIALRTDDVFCHEFLSGIVFSGGDLSDLVSFKPPASWNTSWTRYIRVSNNDAPLPGPYLLNRGRYWDVYRLYDDSINAFTTAFRPTNLQQEKLLGLTIQRTYHTSRSIAVPSRLRTKESPTVPLSGMRITVKDMFQIKGFRTSLGSRAYLDLYPPASRTAPAIQKLIGSGAIVLGLTQLCSMVGTTEPTQCIDFQAPFNPRGDGYQSPSGGSNGQPSAIAAYEWLDIAIGSDSTISGHAKSGQNLWEHLLLAPILGAPEIVIPIGQVEYDSRVSNRLEHLPVCASILGLPGSDRDLIDLASMFLVSANRAVKVSTGREMFGN
ncbi:hypothetical protein B7494_g1791 [Chlorociboria aeruginascens]|nr:hypothetical protein B7494_g1791 [Chlorociboria aeruginascens]